MVGIGVFLGAFSHSSAVGQDAPKIVFHAAGDGVNFAAADEFVFLHLTKDLQLEDVTYRATTDIEEGEYDTFDGVVFSPTNNSGDGRSKGIKTTTTPVFNWEDSLYKDTEGDFYFQISDRRGVAGLNQAGLPLEIEQIEIIDDSHPLAAGLSAGVHTIYRTPQAASWAAVDGFPADALGIATIVPGEGNPEHEFGAVWGIFGAEPGTTVLDGSTTPARRAGFPAFEESISQFTPEGYRLFAAGVSWTLGIDPPQEGDVNVDGVIDMADFTVIANNFFTGEFEPGSAADGYTPEKLRWRDEGDVTWDRVVDFADFGLWKVNSQAGGPAAAAVPEPGSALLLVGAAVIGFFHARQRRKCLRSTRDS
jgi:hypothetical protein